VSPPRFVLVSGVGESGLAAGAGLQQFAEGCLDDIKTRIELFGFDGERRQQLQNLVPGAGGLDDQSVFKGAP